MNAEPMTPAEEFEFYSQPENLRPQGPARRRTPKLSDPIAVRFPPSVLEQIRVAAAAEDRSVSSWIRRAVSDALPTPSR
ncbi:Arc family DNA-binding protein [Candidatus Poriferisodalis sp.]|uniref:Arc family DNA-binding protein n=1 Tax=Candidatus Poriferisodalis sp. TaxID=3101277 RepID=UPI003C6FCC70